MKFRLKRHHLIGRPWLWEWLNDGTISRPWHGLAFHDIWHPRALMVALPFHLLVQLWLHAWFCFRRGVPPNPGRHLRRIK